VQHVLARVDAVNRAVRPDGGRHLISEEPRARADVEHVRTGSQVEHLDDRPTLLDNVRGRIGGLDSA